MEENKKIKAKFKRDQTLIRTSKSFLTKRTVNDKDLIPGTNASVLPVIKEIIDDISDKLIVKPKIILFGKECSQQRDVGFFSNESEGYKYSNKLMASQPLTDNMKLLLEFVNNLYSSEYNGILINRYDSGEQYIGAHSDDETSLDKNGVIALSYGTERKFRIRDKITKKIRLDVPLSHLSIIHMGGEFQKEFTHEVPVEKKVKGKRISLTFRKHLT